MDKTKVTQAIFAYARTRYQLTLATFGDHPWIATLYYAVDEQLNFYVLTDPASIHGQHIDSNAAVAVAIADAPQAPSTSKQGIQLWGTAHEILGKQNIIKALSLWKKALSVTSEKYSYEGMITHAIHGRMYQIIPKQIKYFNESLGEESKEQLITLD